MQVFSEEDYTKMIARAASKFSNQGMTSKEVESTIGLAIAEARKSYDPAKGVPFGAYAQQHIRGILEDELFENGRNVRIPKSERKHLKEIREVQERYRREYDCEPTCKELCEETGIEHDIVYELVHMHLSEERLDEPIGWDEEGESETLADRLADMEAAYQETLREQVDEALRGKTVVQIEVMRRYYLEGENPMDIARDLGIGRTQLFRLMK